MSDLQPLAPILIIVGVGIAVAGLVLLLGPRVPLLGHLPGGIVIRREDVTIYLPFGTILVVSLMVSVVLGVLGLLGRR